MRSFKLGRAFGIEIRVDWSWVFIFVLLTWNLFAVFSRWHPGWSPFGIVAVAAAASAAFFGCILIHELAHSLVATRFGMRVRSITLFLFGGVSNVEHEPRSAGAEFLIAIVGPIASVLLGVGFVFLGTLLRTGAGPATNPDLALLAVEHAGPLATLLLWLGPINIVIGVFNLIPGFPLDGGRVLRSVLWAVTGDLHKATRWAANFGQGIGWLFILTGIAMAFGASVPFLGGGLVAGLWLAFIGWFLRTAASHAGIRLAIDESFAGHTVEELMTRTGAAVPPELPIATLVHDYFVRSDERAVPVVRDDRLVGLVSLSEVRATPIDLWASTSVGEVMRTAESLSVVRPDEPLAAAFEDIARQDVDSLPVLSDNRLVGMLRRKDVTRWLELVWRPGARGPGPWGGGGGLSRPRAM